jgi:hypothetical protein
MNIYYMQLYNADNQKFKNQASAAFYSFFYEKLRAGEIDRAQFFDRMGVGISPANQMQFFTGLRNGHKSVTIEHITAAWEHYRVAPNYLFGVSPEPVSMVAEPEIVYKKAVTKDISKIRALLDQLEKKIENG